MMLWKNLPQNVFINIWDRCDVAQQRSLSELCETWLTFVANRLRLPDSPLAKWNTDYLPESRLPFQLIEDDFTLVRVYFQLCAVRYNFCYLMDKVIKTGHGLERLFKLVALTRLEYAFSVLFELQNRFRPDMGELYGSDMEGRIVYYEDDYYAHLMSRMKHTSRIYLASTLLEGLRCKRLFEVLVDTMESTDPVELDKVVLRFSQVDPDYFQLMICRKRVLDRVAKKYADTVNDSTPIETRILNISLYLQNFSAQESSVVTRVPFLTPKRGLLSRYYGGDIAKPPLFIFTCALCEALKACGFKCFIVDWERLLFVCDDKVYICKVDEELVIREVVLDCDEAPRPDESAHDYDYSSDQERLLQLGLEKLGRKTTLEALTLVRDSIAGALRTQYYGFQEGTETEMVGGRSIIFPRAQPYGDYNLCARSEEMYFTAPLIFMEHLTHSLTYGHDVHQADRTVALNRITPASAKAMIISGHHSGLQFLKGRYRIELTKPYSDVFFPKALYGDEEEYLYEAKNGTVSRGGEIVLHTSRIEATSSLERRDSSSGASFTADEKELLASAEPDSIGRRFCRFDWQEKRWIPNKLFQINCKEFDRGEHEQFDMLDSGSDWETSQIVNDFTAIIIALRDTNRVRYCSYGTSSRSGEAESVE